MPASQFDLATASRLPAPGDNVAIAVRRLDAGTRLESAKGPVTIASTILEGHRFAVKPIARGGNLLSWGLPFGTATAPISPGDYVCNTTMLEALGVRRIDGLVLPSTPNFTDPDPRFVLDENRIHPAPPVEREPHPRTFEGFRRPGSRGTGTRNTMVILGTTSRTASFARQLAARLQPLARVHPTLDGIVPIAHTEGGGPGEPNNTAEVLRTLAGFMVHPNVGAVLAVDYGLEPITNARLEAFMRENDYPLDEVPHAFLSLRDGLAAGLEAGERIVRGWLPVVAGQRRTTEPLNGLRVALQCGGSDAFSGVSGNPLAGAIVHELVRHGGVGVLSETDETTGAEDYLLANVRDLATARKFCEVLGKFRQKLTWHGLTAESNPSAGNRFRGLYNIVLKSLGAVHKKDPRTRLDTIIDYAEPLRGIANPGFTFMNGPGNDLECIAGEIATGCNLILFITGNGSVTNFPFVPTLKIMTTTGRYELLAREMDINAGRTLDGEPMEALAAESFELLIRTASGGRTKGEHAGHSQVSLLRNWRQTDTSQLARLHARVAPDGAPLKAGPELPAAAGPVGGGADGSLPEPRRSRRAELGTSIVSPVFDVFQSDTRYATERLGLVLPTSLCSAQIARLAADRLNASRVGLDRGFSRFVALAHTEGCGFGGDTMYQLLQRTYRGYLSHPNVAAALLLEHGCEKIPNDVMRQQLENDGVPLDRYGWASVQLDGGIEKTLQKIEAWFNERLAALPPATPTPADLGALTLALMTASPVSHATARTLAWIARAVVSHGGSLLLPEGDPLLANQGFLHPVLGATPPHATLAYGQPMARPGLHVVSTETDHWVENLTGLCGNGAHLALGVVSGHAQQGHPLIPLIQAAEATQRGIIPACDIDLFLTGDSEADPHALAEWIAAVAGCKRVPAAPAQGFVDFQLTRGLLGLTT